MTLNLPKISKLIFEHNGNEIWQYFGGEFSLSNPQIISTDPFLIESTGINYFLTSDISDQNIEGNRYVLITSKKPQRTDLISGKINDGLNTRCFKPIRPQRWLRPGRIISNL